MKNAGVVGATMSWVASSGGVDGFDGVDGGGFDGFEWRRMVASMASLVVWWPGGVDGVDGWRRSYDGGLSVFDTEGTDVECPSVSPVVRTARTCSSLFFV